jgi:hypothetical protein
MGVLGPYTGLAHCSGGPRPRNSSAPSAPALTFNPPPIFLMLPLFLGAGGSETNIVMSTTITGDSQCVSTNGTYRLDTAFARAFLAQFVALP